MLQRERGFIKKEDLKEKGGSIERGGVSEVGLSERRGRGALIELLRYFVLLFMMAGLLYTHGLVLWLIILIF